MIRLLPILLFVSCTSTINCGQQPIDAYSKKEIEQAFKDRDAYLGKLSEAITAMEKKNEK